MDEREPGVGRGVGAVGARAHQAAERGGFRGCGVDEKPPRALGEGLELRPQRIDLAVVAANVVDEADGGVIPGQRAVGLAGLGRRRAVGGAEEKEAVAALADARRQA